MSKAKINRAIRHTGLTVHGARGDYCFYFINANGDQIGETVYVAYLNHLTIGKWVAEAENAIEGGN